MGQVRAADMIYLSFSFDHPRSGWGDRHGVRNAVMRRIRTVGRCWCETLIAAEAHGRRPAGNIAGEGPNCGGPELARGLVTWTVGPAGGDGGAKFAGDKGQDKRCQVSPPWRAGD